MKVETKLAKIKAMPDSNLKLLKIMVLGTTLGIFDKAPIKAEMKRLMDAGYTAYPY